MSRALLRNDVQSFARTRPGRKKFEGPCPTSTSADLVTEAGAEVLDTRCVARSRLA